MLNPEFLASLPEAILKLFYAAERQILVDMARKIVKYDYYVPSAEYQRQKLREAGVMQDEILTALAKLTRRSEEELRQMMQEACGTSLRGDTAIYEAAGLTVPSIGDNGILRQILNAGYKATAQTMRNLCKTTARTAAQQFENALDGAWLKVHSGAFDSETAIRSAIKDLSQKGIQAIRYPSGRTDSLETAVRRAVVTGVNQTSAQLQEELADELDCDLVEVSAHAGARPEHAVWQGRIFSRSGTHPKYPDFRAATGYGRVDGLCGANCRHTFSPYIEGSPPVWSEEELKKLDEPKYEYNGQKLTEYEASQIQRNNERQIRRWQREYAAMEAAGLDTSEAATKIRHWQEEQNAFLKETGLERQYDREFIGQFDYAHINEVDRQAEKFYQEWSKSMGVNDAIKTLAKYYDVKYNDSPRYELLKDYVNSVESGRMSPITHFDLYESHYGWIQREIVGTTVNGIEIKGQTAHFLERVFGTGQDPKTGKPRNGVTLEEIADCLKNPVHIAPIRIDSLGRKSFVVVGRTAKVSINADTGLLIQTNPWSE